MTIAMPGSAKLWRWGGVYPDTSLASARKLHQVAREKLAAGTDSSDTKRLEKFTRRMAAAKCAGNIAPAAEFNYWQDPDAADIVFRSGADLTMVGLDICHQTHLSPSQVEEFSSHGTPLGQFVQASSAPRFQIMAGASGSGSLHLYDSLAMAMAMLWLWIRA